MCADQVKLGEIFRFYQDEFIAAYKKKSGKSDLGLLEAIEPFAAADSPVHGTKSFEFIKYDWSLNQAK